MKASRRAALASIAGIALAASFAIAPAAAQDRILVFAAASLREALQDVAAAWARESGKRATISFAASSALARQIEAGAPADMFVSADLEWMDYLQQRNLIRPETRADLLSNALVLIAPKDSRATGKIASGFDVAAMLHGGRLAMANTEAVPAGKYGKAALQRLAVWDAVKDKVVQADNVRAALLFVGRGEAPLGIVYRTDAMADPAVRIVDTFPEGTHPPIVYPAALTTNAGAEAASLLAYMRSKAAKPLFDRRGFVTALD